MDWKSGNWQWFVWVPYLVLTSILAWWTWRSAQAASRSAKAAQASNTYAKQQAEAARRQAEAAEIANILAQGKALSAGAEEEKLVEAVKKSLMEYMGRLVANNSEKKGIIVSPDLLSIKADIEKILEELPPQAAILRVSIVSALRTHLGANPDRIKAGDFFARLKTVDAELQAAFAKKKTESP